VRQHVNPLSVLYQQPLALPSPTELFADPSLPLHLDIGAARGRFLLAMAERCPTRNHLGVEIRRPLVVAAEADRQAAGLTNLRYLFGNASLNLVEWLQDLPPGLLQLVTLQFPDPWFKSRHHKRRVLQPALLRSLALALPPGGTLLMQSDVLAVIAPMVALVEASGCFERPASDPVPWLETNPLAVPTERERHVLAQGLPVYRVRFRRHHGPVPGLGDPQAAHNPCVATQA
jgi:tRNA (guanine-N7-)-methyltransferase